MMVRNAPWCVRHGERWLDTPAGLRSLAIYPRASDRSVPERTAEARAAGIEALGCGLAERPRVLTSMAHAGMPTAGGRERVVFQNDPGISWR